MLDDLDRLPRFERAVHTARSWSGTRLDLLALGHKDLAPGTRYRFDNARRAEDACILQVTLAGEGRFAERGDERPQRRGDAFLIELPSPTAYWLPDGAAWRFVYLYFGGELARFHVRHANARRGRRLTIADDEPALEPLAALCRHARERREADEATVATLLHAVLVHLHARPAAPDPADPAARARRAIERDWRDADLGVDALARAAGCSRFHLSRRFKAAYGESPYAYLLALRLRRAQELLATTDLAAAEVAQRTGFREAWRFAHAFRERLGVAPGAYRRRARGG